MPDSPAAVFARLCAVHRPVNPPVLFNKATVLGGSIAGLLAARVLAEHSQQVVIVERDIVTGGGVPQSPQVHTLLPGGRAQFERWFPGLVQEAEEAGAVLSGPGRTAAYADDRLQVRTENAVLLTSSRPFLEALIRQRTLKLPNVKVVSGLASGLCYVDGEVSAVRYRTNAGEQVEHTDFVVDAMGRASRLSDWLEVDGWDRPSMQRLPIEVNYATALFKRSEAEPEIGAAIARYTSRFPDRTQGAVNAVENGQWMVMLVGYGNDRPGRTEADFRVRCAKLPAPFGAATRGEMVGGVATYRQSDSRRRDFAELDQFPARLVSIGDAVASFNPVYGQGMSSAALQASCLSEYLNGNPNPARPAQEFFALQQVVVDAAWELSTGADAARLGGPPKPPARIRLQRWVQNQVLDAAISDPKIATAFNEVTFMSAHPSTLATPGTALRAIVGNRIR